MFGWEEGKVDRWETYMFGWKEKWDDGKWSWYKFTIISSSNKTKKYHFFFFLIKNIVYGQPKFTLPNTP